MSMKHTGTTSATQSCHGSWRVKHTHNNHTTQTGHYVLNFPLISRIIQALTIYILFYEAELPDFISRMINKPTVKECLTGRANRRGDERKILEAACVAKQVNMLFVMLSSHRRPAVEDLAAPFLVQLPDNTPETTEEVSQAWVSCDLSETPSQSPRVRAIQLQLRHVP